MVMRGLGAVLLIAAGVLVAGCTGEAAPVEPTGVTTPEVSESATPTPSPTPAADVTVPPERPAAMATPSAEGAAAAASYFISLYPYVLATGDLTEWNAMSTETCDFCTNTRTEVDQLQSAGLRSIGGVEVMSASGKALGSHNWYAADLSVRMAPSTDVEADGTVVATNDGGEYDLNFAMTWSDRWIIDSAGIVTAPTE